MSDINEENVKEEKCKCNDDCNCGDECKCDSEHKCSENCTCGDECHCGENCTCGDECHCNDESHCNEECECSKEKCGEECDCDTCREENDKSLEYLNLAKQVQADFDNFRRHAIEDIKQARISGQASVIEVFLPVLDTFKEAKKSITDENVLKGVEMIENSVNDALKTLGVTKINSIGEKYNPHLHNVIAVMKDEEKDNDIVLDEYQAGYKFNDKVLRYAKVIVNKKED